MNIQDNIKLAALDLAEDETIMGVCPYCEAQHERSFGVTRKAEGLLFHCFRASCGASGFVPSGSRARKKHHKEFKQCTIPHTLLTDTAMRWLSDRYEISGGWLGQINLADAERRHFFLPMRNLDMSFAGWQLRKFDGSKPKSINYPTKLGPYIQTFERRLPFNKGPFYVVEDYFSMLKVQEALRTVGHAGMAVSIIGTHISDDVAVWMGKRSAGVVLMLDPDATHKSFKFAHQYRLLWPSTRVVVLDSDPKDTPMNILQEVVV